ncbi:MAG: acetyl-CoA carboxylase carboxyltransferase subunit alpha [Acidobacteriota bacterium]|nr:acetyl-CoA carboxylase carboxyltransferase subunit alpha [Acidobacteriota bacterium]MDQ7086850.1 acetyl-CoA carboxylase carboxyltransferase subunit alpha [Acidobacteriota bacterium]
MSAAVPFEKPIVELEQKIEELAGLADPALAEEIARLREQLLDLRRKIYSRLDPWQITQVARHPRRPYTLDYIQGLMEGWQELHGDRRFADDRSLLAGFAFFKGRPVAVVGHQKGRQTRQKIERNFGMPRPEGYRKALRVMQLAEKFGRPVIAFVDTPGAYPGLDAEERGQAEAIATNLREMARLRVPVVVTVTGEGGSGGALAIAVGNRINMLEFAIYSVISPEGCASILWRDAGKAEEMAGALKLTARDLKELDVIDEVIEEPPGGAHSDVQGAIARVGETLERQLADLAALGPDELVDQRYDRFRRMGRFSEVL